MELKTVMITGASSGFGAACAEVFSQNGYRIILNARRKDKLVALAEKLKEKYHTDSMIVDFDVRDKLSVYEAANSLPEEWQKIDILINNAGLAAGRDLFDEANMDDWENMIQTNVLGLLYVTRAFLPFLLQGQQKHIINIGSVAAKEVYERGNVYCASKAAVDSISKSLRIDLLKHAFKVTAIHPGAAETEFSLVRLKGDTEKAKAVYVGYEALQAVDVANMIYYTTSLPSHVCINDVVITCTAQANAYHTYKP
ncbi:MAG: SDR family NAD(P)-dependent oxidoreductase [Bacteroidota bacterium]